MPIALAEVEPSSVEPGAPIPKDRVDPDLVKLRRARPKISLFTAAGVVFLCALYLWRLGPDRRFSGSAQSPEKASVADVLAGKIDLESYIAIDAEPLAAHAIRSTTAKGSFGYRVVPARGTGERLWLVVPGDGWEAPQRGAYVGRLRKLADLPLAKSVIAYTADHPRPMFATPAAARAGFASSKVAMVTGDQLEVRDADRVAFEVIDPGTATIVASTNERFPDAAAWQKAIEAAGITVGPPHVNGEQITFPAVATDALATLTAKLEAASLWAARVDPVTNHLETTWGQLKSSPAGGFVVDGKTIPETQIDLIGLYVARGMPDGAYALITGERPKDYWFVLPVTILIGVIGLLFAWALVRAIKRDVLPARA
jgi:hypothetical protein